MPRLEYVVVIGNRGTKAVVAVLWFESLTRPSWEH